MVNTANLAREADQRERRRRRTHVDLKVYDDRLSADTSAQ